MAKFSDSELVALLNSEESQAVGFYGGEVSEQRRKAMQYYYGQPFGNEVEGRSKYVSHDVSEAVEMVMPALMRIFFAGDKVVRFEPQNPNDEEAAKQATDYINYIITRQNNGFLACYQWFKDALLQKNGFLKVYWEEKGEIKKENYEGLTQDELQVILTKPGVEPLEYSTEVDPATGQITYDLKVSIDNTMGKVCIDPVPPEEVLVARGSTIDMQKSPFIGHRMRKTVSEWKILGYDVSPEEGDSQQEYDQERLERRKFDEDFNFSDDSQDPAQRKVWGLEAYVRVDYDDDGIAELRKILKIGNKIYDNEEIDRIPFVTLTPYIMSHKMFGMSLADHLMDIQELKSTFIRQMLDNLYNLNNGRWMVLEGMVNIQDALNSTPGGVVRVKTFDAMKRLDTPQLPGQAWQVLEWLDMEKESRTGLSKYTPGPSENVLSRTATGANIRNQRISERIELIARVFAETGFRDLNYAVLELVQKHQNKPQMVRLRDRWVPMNPREWAEKFDMSVSVGLGTGSKDQVIQSIGMLYGMQLQAIQAGAGIVQPVNLHNTIAKFAEASDMKGEGLYVTHPSQVPPQPKQPDPAIMKAQMDNQAKMQMTAMKDETAKWKHATNLEMKQQQQAIQAANEEMKRQFEGMQAELDRQLEVLKEAGNRDTSQADSIQLVKDLISKHERQVERMAMEMKLQDAVKKAKKEERAAAGLPDEDAIAQEAEAEKEAQKEAEEQRRREEEKQMEMQNQQILLQILQSNQQMMQQVGAMIATLGAPKKRVPIRDSTGKITEVTETLG